MTSMVLNSELNGVELYFDNKPIQNVLDSLKDCGFRWSNFKKCWYAKQNEKTLTEAQKYTEQNINIIPEVTEAKKTTKTQNKLLSLFERIQFVEGENKSNKNYKFVGSNYTGLSVKETAAEIRKHLKTRFPEVKFSVTSDSHKIYVEIKSSCYAWDKLEYSPEKECREYRDFEEEHNKELLAIKEYCQKLLDSYNWDDSDSMTDYFSCHYYDSVSIDYEYKQTEQNEQIKAEIVEFRNKLAEQAKAEEEKKEAEWQARLNQQEEDHKQYLIRQEQEKKEIEIINADVTVKDVTETEQYYIMGSQFANLNKNCTLDEYKEEVLKGDYESKNIKITRELHFNTADALNYFSNMLLVDFDFLAGANCGDCTDDVRIQSMTDYQNMDSEERETIEWYLQGVAVYYNNELQFVIDTSGHSYARYVGLVENVTKQNELVTEQKISIERVTELKEKADTLTDISTDIITELDIVKTWNNENWTEYKDLMKEQLKHYKIKLAKPIVQQIPEDMEELKVAMYKLLIEVDGLQEQFKNADIQQGEKITMFYISEWGSIVTSRVTLDHVDFESYAQYTDAVKLTFKPENKRNLYYKYHYSDMLVYSGWLELPVTVLHNVEYRNGVTTTMTKYGSCDKKQYDEIINYFIEQDKKPIINTYKPIFD